MWLLLAACVEVAPTGRPFEPVREAPAADVAVEAAAFAPPAPTDGFDFDAEDRKEDAAADTAPPTVEEAAAALGLAPLPPGTPAPAAPPEPPPVAAAPVAAPPPVAAAPLASFPPPPSGWGVRLVSTVPDAQPPRAILGLADGKETVVVPGDLLPEARLVVMAVGRDAVQLAEITPVGDHAAVHTYTVNALFPTVPPRAP